MRAAGAEAHITELLRGMNALGGYPMSLVCTAEGLLVATAGEATRSEVAAGLTSLFDDIVARAVRDLALTQIDEITLIDPRAGRFIVRPLTRTHEPRLFLVVLAPPDATWRRNTNLVARRLMAILAPLLAPTS